MKRGWLVRWERPEAKSKEAGKDLVASVPIGDNPAERRGTAECRQVSAQETRLCGRQEEQ